MSSSSSSSSLRIPSYVDLIYRSCDPSKLTNNEWYSQDHVYDVLRVLLALDGADFATTLIYSECTTNFGVTALKKQLRYLIREFRIGGKTRILVPVVTKTRGAVGSS